MKINILHNHIIFGEFLDHFSEVLKTLGHQVRVINRFEYDDSDLTISTDTINTLSSLVNLDHRKYPGKIIHWLLEIFPPDQRRSFISEFRINQFRVIKDKFDHIFVRDPRQIEEMDRVFGIRPNGYLLSCPNPKLHRKSESEKKYDVLFIGNMSDRRVRAFEQIRNKGIQLFIPSKYVWEEEKIKLIQESKIVINVHYDETNVFETLRVMECLGSGGFLLTEDFEWYPENKLTAGVDFASAPYDKFADAVEFYLTHPEERSIIERNGYQAAWKNFDWKEEFNKMLNVLSVCPICQGASFKDFEKKPKYKICQKCTFHRQDPLPEKVYEGPEENYGMGPHTGHLMSEDDKTKNRAIADALYSMFQPKTVLDIGSKYPYFLSVLKDRSEVLGIDGIDDVLKYGEELGVPVLKADFETMDITPLMGKYDLITLIHLAEHLYDPVNTFQKILSCLSDRGVLYIRTPDPEVLGIERDLTDHHLTIHPHLFTKKSLETLVARFGCEIFRHDKLEGYGQSDFYVRKNLRGDTSISLFMIVKNEEKNIGDCLESIRKYVDEIIVVDTGSTDNTKEVVSKYTDKIYDFPWIDDFAAARNFALAKCTKAFCLWADADDVFQNPQEIKNALKENFDAFNFNVIYGNDVFCHARLFRNFSGVHFKGKVHEYPVLHWLPFKTNTKLNVIHKTQKHVTEDRIERNIRILRKEIEEDPGNARAMFYLANALKENGGYEEAISIYQNYLKVSTWRDERFMAQKYIGQIYQWQKQYTKSTEEFFKAILIDDRWAESYYYIGENYYYLGKPEMCIRWMQFAASMQVPDSTLFKEMAIYRDLPYRYIFACYDTMRNYEEAYEYCLLAIEKNPGDNWLRQRLSFFEEQKNKTPKKPTQIIECYRQGAKGDIVMTTSALRSLKEKYPGCFIRYITHPSNFDIIIGNKFVDEVTTEGKDDATLKYYFSYPESEGYPHKPLNRHLIKIFNECADVPDIRQSEVTLTEEEDSEGFNTAQVYGKYVTLHVQAGWSPYKEWYDDRWEVVIEHLFRKKITVIQLGAPKDRRLNNAVDMRGLPIKKSIAVIKHAQLHLGVDSVLSHAAAAVGTPLFELFGSTSPIGSGYEHYIWKGLECSPCYREYEWAKDPIGPCPYNKKCMDQITVEEVIKEIEPLLWK